MLHAHAWTLPFALSSVASLLFCSAWLPELCNNLASSGRSDGSCVQARPAPCKEGLARFIVKQRGGSMSYGLLHVSGLQRSPSPEDVVYRWERSGPESRLLAATLMS